ncbi:MAG: polysaccharide deacetylase family protein, partial [Halioglobus sp.]|nr:polysaccharide deacetylase family protein [Halioglobus sp.]
MQLRAQLVLGLGAVMLAFLALLLWSYDGAIWRFSVEDKVVALTFDVGPNPPYTQMLLALLNTHQVKATFLPRGRHIQAFPELARN